MSREVHAVRKQLADVMISAQHYGQLKALVGHVESCESKKQNKKYLNYQPIHDCS